MRFQELYKAYTQAHGLYRMKGVGGTGKVEGGAQTVKGAPTEEAWQAHLSGKGPGLGLVPLLDDNTSVFWSAIDIDRYPIDHAALERDCANLPITITKSKSGGAHLWMFFKEPTNAKLVMSKLQQLSAALGYGGVEVFPKQHTRVADRDVGNWINLPYFGETRRAIYKGEEVDLEAFLELAAARQITEAQLRNITFASENEGGHFADGPPCLQQIAARGMTEGGRNNLMFNVSIYAKHKSPEGWKDLVFELNKVMCNPPLGRSEVENTMQRSTELKNYNYTCNKSPINSFCNRALCTKREFGVAAGTDSNELNYVIEGLTQIMTQPPRWLVNIDGVRIELETSDLMDQGRFKKYVVEVLYRVPSKVGNKKWDEIWNELLTKVEKIEAPPEASPQGQFVEHLGRYVELNGQSESRDMLLNGRVWIDQGWAHFRSTDFYNYLKRERFTELKSSAMFSLLHEIGMVKDRFNCKGTTVAFWKVPLAKLNGSDVMADAPTFENPFGETPPNE